MANPIKFSYIPRWTLLFPFLGVVAHWYITCEWGIGLSPDSSGYLFAARGIVDGRGLVEIAGWNKVIPLCNFAPMLSTVLGLLGRLGIEPQLGVQWLHRIVFGANIFLTCLMTFHFTGSRWISALSSFFVLTSLVTLEIHAMVWSEPLFIFFGFPGIFLLGLYFEDITKKSMLILSGLFLGCSFLSKYSGSSFVMAGVLAILFYKKTTFPQKITDCLIIGGLGSLPMSLWCLRNRLSDAWPTGLTFNFEPYVLGHVRSLVAHISIWILPKSIFPIFRGAVLFVLVAFLIFAVYVNLRRMKHPAPSSGRSPMFYESHFPWILLAVIASHLGVYFASTAFLGENPFDNRALSPVFIASIIFILGTGHGLWRLSPRGGVCRILLSAIVVFFALTYLWRGVQWGLAAKQEGLWYSGREWVTTDIIARVKKLPVNIPIYTNGPDVIYLLTGKAASAIPAKANVFKVHVPDPKRRLLENYPEEIEKMKKDLRQYDGFVVFLDMVYWRWYYPTAEELGQSVPLRVHEKLQGGTIYKLSD